MLTVLFIITFVLITTLVGVKMYEISVGKQTVLTQKLAQFDPKVESMLHTAYLHAEVERHRAWYAVREDLPKEILRTAVNLKETLQKKYFSMFPNIRGVRVLNTERDASPFLQNLSIERQRDGKGRIEDNLNL